MTTNSHSMLTKLPYELLLGISAYLEHEEVIVLRQTCTTLRQFCFARPVYRQLAEKLLHRCRALPLDSFQRLSELSNQELVRVVDRAFNIDTSWRTRTPRLTHHRSMGTPPDEEVDWLSPIASAYVLCSTRTGSVYCWDTEQDKAVAVYHPKHQLELWKCRVEFDAREVYFTLARCISGMRENRLIEFLIMRLTFPASEDPTPPAFETLATFNAVGAVMNVFLLDPLARILSIFTWLPTTNTIGLYVLLDWSSSEVVYIDTGITCIPTGNWSCILYDDTLIVHEETPVFATQHIYPLSMFHALAQSSPKPNSQVPPPDTVPRLVPPASQLTRYFLFPVPSPKTGDGTDATDSSNAQDPTEDDNHLDQATGVVHFEGMTGIDGSPAVLPIKIDNEELSVFDRLDTLTFPGLQNPFPWFPDACHFVRQWWPTSLTPTHATSSRRVSCTVLLLSRHDTETHINDYVLAQHYFGTPLIADASLSTPSSVKGPRVTHDRLQWTFPSSPARAGPRESRGGGVPMRMWYVDEPFRVVCAPDPSPDMLDDEEVRERPLLAVDFGHAVWIEHFDPLEGQDKDNLPPECYSSQAVNPDGSPVLLPHLLPGRRLRFVSFPPIMVNDHGEEVPIPGLSDRHRAVSGVVHTLKTPPGLFLEEVETINVDQSQGAILLSVTSGRVWVLYYE